MAKLKFHSIPRCRFEITDDTSDMEENRLIAGHAIFFDEAEAPKHLHPTSGHFDLILSKSAVTNAITPIIATNINTSCRNTDGGYPPCGSRVILILGAFQLVAQQALRRPISPPMDLQAVLDDGADPTERETANERRQTSSSVPFRGLPSTQRRM